MSISDNFSIGSVNRAQLIKQHCETRDENPQLSSLFEDILLLTEPDPLVPYRKVYKPICNRPHTSPRWRTVS